MILDFNGKDGHKDEIRYSKPQPCAHTRRSQRERNKNRR